MKLLVLTSSLALNNGYGVLCRSLVEALRESGQAELDVFSGEARPSWRLGREHLKGERISVRPYFWRFYVLADLLTLAFRARGSYHAVVVLVEHYAAAGWIFSRWMGIPLVAAQAGTYAVKLPTQLPFFRRVLAGAHRILPISRYTRQRMEEEGVEGRYQVVTPGVNASKFRRPPRPRRREVVFVGNFKARKGLSFLLDALGLAKASVPDVRLKVIGKVDKLSPVFAEYQKRILDEDLPVDFTGSVSDAELAEIYASARLNALPSQSERFFFEGFGLIHLEANACGTLTVGTLESGNEDAIGPGCGYLIKYGDVEELARVIVEAMRLDPYPEIASGSLRSWNDMAEDYLKILQDATPSHSDAGRPRGHDGSKSHI